MMRTLPFKMPASKFAMHLLATKGIWLLIVGAGLILAAVGVGLVLADYRYFIVALMILFLVVPLTLLTVYMGAALRPECFCNTRLHTVALEDEGITVTMPEETVIKEYDDDEKEEVVYKSQSYHWDASCCRGLTLSGSNMFVTLRGEKINGFLWIDGEAFVKDVEAKNFYDRLRKWVY